MEATKPISEYTAAELKEYLKQKEAADQEKQIKRVVNCFQNCIFTYDSQPLKTSNDSLFCCELLSELYFYL